MNGQIDALRRSGAVALIAAGVGTVVTMSHHPSGAHGGALGPIVHGAMIMFLALLAFGFAGMAAWRGAAKPLIVAGAVAYAVSLLGHAGAATINGFAVPAMAARGHGAVSHDVFILAWELNQALAKLGVFATSAAFLLWSLDFLRDDQARLKVIGVAGLLAGLIPPILLLAGTIRMDVAGAMLTYALQAAWGVLVGAAMLFGSMTALANAQSANALST